jgi:hypothetical protein
MGKIVIWHEHGYGKLPRISFQEWKRRGGGKPGSRYLVFRIFTPKRFPSYSLRWVDPEMKVEVAANIKKDIFFQILEGDDGWNPKKLLYYIVKDDMTDGFEVEDKNHTGKTYQKDEYGYILRYPETQRG